MVIITGIAVVALSLAQNPLPAAEQTEPGAPRATTLPADWPPVPTFREPIDYVKWLNDRLERGRGDDAVPLYWKLSPRAASLTEAEAANARRWGENKKGELPGLFTGETLAPERYAWDPNDHADWERAYQVNRQLHDEMLAVSRKRYFAGVLKPLAPQDESPRMLISDGPPLLSVDLGPFASVRKVAKVLLQNAWRAPGGQPDHAELKTAIMATLRMARQLTALSPSTLHMLVAVSLRDLAYDSALRALEEGVFDDEDAAELSHFLASTDDWRADPVSVQPIEAAFAFDLLQYCYRPTGNRRGTPQPNEDHLEILSKRVKHSHEMAPEYMPEPLDLAGEINRCSAHAGVEQVIAIKLAMREIMEKNQPRDVETKIDALAERLRSDPKNHVIVRQFCADGTMGRAATLCSRNETRRRAVRVIFLLDAERRKTGQWPASLRQVRGLAGNIARLDPYSRKEFIYRTTPDGMTLYSVATNGQDDGGRHHQYWGEILGESKTRITDGDFVFWPVQRNP